MIINFYINCKDYEEVILKNYNFHNYECPKCGNKHSWNRHGSYERNVIFFKDNIFIEGKMSILRLKCMSCRSTHAVLPGDLIPYYIFTLSSIIKILIEHFEDNLSVLCIAKKYNISFQLIYSFLTTYSQFINECISTFRILDIIKGTFVPSPEKLLKLIVTIKTYHINHFKINKWPFLMKKFRNKYPILIYVGANYS